MMMLLKKKKFNVNVHFKNDYYKLINPAKYKINKKLYRRKSF